VKVYLENVIREFVAQYPKDHQTQSRWQEPLVSFVDALNPQFVLKGTGRYPYGDNRLSVL